MIAATPLGDFRSDIVNFVGSLPGLSRDKVGRWMTDGETYLKNQVQRAVEPKIKPPIYLAIGLGAVGLLLGGIALARTFRKK